MRLRTIVMNKFYPRRANERAAWLYNHILRGRESFIKIGRREMRRRFFKDDPTRVGVERHNCLDTLRAKYNQYVVILLYCFFI